MSLKNVELGESVCVCVHLKLYSSFLFSQVSHVSTKRAVWLSGCPHVVSVPVSEHECVCWLLCACVGVCVWGGTHAHLFVHISVAAAEHA